MTQKKAYMLAVKENMKKPGGVETGRNMTMVQEEVEKVWKMKVKEKEVWKGLKKIDQPQIAQFIWKIAHGRIKCGRFFRFIPQWTDKEFCKCGKTESVEHILFECEESHQEAVWLDVKEKWEKKTKLGFKQPKIGTLIALGAVKIESKKDRKRRKWERLYRVMVATASWSIWKMRNRRIFEGIQETEEAQRESWEKLMKDEGKVEKWKEKQDKNEGKVVDKKRSDKELQKAGRQVGSKPLNGTTATNGLGSVTECRSVHCRGQK